MTQKTKNIIKWILSVFFLLSTLSFFPSVASIFMGLLGVFLLPISPIQEFIKKHLTAKWMRMIVAVILFFIAMLTVPSNPTNTTVDPIENTGSYIQETINNTSSETSSEPTAPTVESTIETTPPATEAVAADSTTAATQPITTLPQESSFEVHFIDVGQADAALVLCDGKAMLIDGGNVADSSKLYSYLNKRNVTHLDYVIGTHAHEDHIGGIAGALNYATVGVAYCPVTLYTTEAFENFTKAVEKHGVSITVPSVGTAFSLGSASCKVLAVNTSSDTNNSSIVLRITYGNTSFLFTGDAEREVEQAILNRGETLNSTVLKVGHHGSETSTSYVWLREIMPQYAVISVGAENSYGHPTEEVLSRLRDADVKTYRTDMQGDIICTSDGQTVNVHASRNADANTFEGIGGNSTQHSSNSHETQKPTEPQATEKATEPVATEKTTEPEEPQEQGTHYVLNTNTMKFHYAGCASAKRIKAENRRDYYGTREELIAMGYSPCGNCDP